jgi:hypothetical protein
MAKSERSKLEKKLDGLWRTVNKKTYCEICATLPQEERVNYHKLECHHIVGRSNKLLRWDLRNRLVVCSSHHTLGRKNVQDNTAGWFWSKFTDSDDWLGKYRPDDKKYLEEMIKIPYKQWTLDELRGKIDKFEKMRNESDEYQDFIIKSLN